MYPRVEIIPILSDNFAYIVHESGEDALAVVDPGAADPVIDALSRLGRHPTEIWLTHKHHDHIGGATKIARKYDIPIRGPQELPSIDARVVQLRHGEQFSFGSHSVKVKEIPGHTQGHLIFLYENIVFCGDVLFVAGCGRCFEGRPQDLYRGIKAHILSLADNTRLFCGHDYSEKNLKFAQGIEPENEAIVKYRQFLKNLKEKGRPAMPTELGREKELNPFLRVERPELVSALRNIKSDLPDSPEDIFAVLRRMRDNF